LGHRVAICEQVEDPAEAKKRGPKSPVKRDVVRLVTPGPLTEADLLPSRPSNYLPALSLLGGYQSADEAELALAFADISTGETGVVDLPLGRLGDELARLQPAELLLGASLAKLLEERRIGLPPDTSPSTLPDTAFDSA